MSGISVVKYGSDLYPEVLALRAEVLRKPLGRVFTPEDLAHDVKFVFFAYIEGGEVLGTVALENMGAGKGQLRQMAVHEKLQGRGIGRKLVEFLEDYAKKDGIREITIDVRIPARGFYNSLGYTEYGDEYVKIGIPHINSRKVF